jgi:hypothetical protein
LNSDNDEFTLNQTEKSRPPKLSESAVITPVTPFDPEPTKLCATTKHERAHGFARIPEVHSVAHSRSIFTVVLPK